MDADAVSPVEAQSIGQAQPGLRTATHSPAPAPRVAGVDGCRARPDGSGGWVAVIVEPDGRMRAERIEQLGDWLAKPEAPAIVAVDMPIGLPERVGLKGRAPERLVRPLLGERQSSVFSLPSRAAVYAAIDPDVPEEDRYRHACAVARATSDPPRAMAKQAFHILGKVIEIDRLLRAAPDLQERVFECHPEVSFRAMFGAPVPIAKNVKNAPHAPGLALRRELLERQGFPAALIAVATARALSVGADDLVDAAAAAWTARRIASGTAVSTPDPPERDGFGLPIGIWC